MECLPLRHIRGIANKRGFSVHVDDTIMHIVHKHGEMIQSSFDLSDPFKIDPACVYGQVVCHAVCFRNHSRKVDH